MRGADDEHGQEDPLDGRDEPHDAEGALARKPDAESDVDRHEENERERWRPARLAEDLVGRQLALRRVDHGLALGHHRSIVAHAPTSHRATGHAAHVSRPEPSSDARGSDRWLELAATILLALATVGTAWSAYQSRQWTGEQSQGYSRATADRIAVNRTAALANRQVQIDVATFIQWIDAHAQNDEALADFYRARFRDEFKPAFAAWLATDPFPNASAPAAPVVLPQDKLNSWAWAGRLQLK